MYLSLPPPPCRWTGWLRVCVEEEAIGLDQAACGEQNGSLDPRAVNAKLFLGSTGGGSVSNQHTRLLNPPGHHGHHGDLLHATSLQLVSRGPGSSLSLGGRPQLYYPHVVQHVPSNLSDQAVAAGGTPPSHCNAAGVGGVDPGFVGLSMSGRHLLPHTCQQPAGLPMPTQRAGGDMHCHGY